MTADTPPEGRPIGNQAHGGNSIPARAWTCVEASVLAIPISGAPGCCWMQPTTGEVDNDSGIFRGSRRTVERPKRRYTTHCRVDLAWEQHVCRE